MKNFLLNVFLATTTLNLFGQSPEFTQISTNLIYTNPAFAGTNICPRGYLSYRNKFISLGSAYQTAYGSYDQFLNALNGDIGITAMHDRQAKGVETNTHISGIYGKSITITSKNILKFAAEFSYLRHSVNTSSVTYPDQIDPYYGFIYSSGETRFNSSGNTFNINAGILLYSNKYFLGLAMHNITQPSSHYSSRYFLFKRRISFHSGTKITLQKGGISKKGEFSLNPIIQAQLEGESSQLSYGLNVTLSKFLAGVWVKQNFGINFDSFTFLVGFVEKKYKFAYNCDIPLSRVSNRYFDSHEFSFTYYFECVESKKKNKAIRCPGI